GGREHRGGARLHALYFCGRGNEGALLYVRPRNVVHRKGGDDVAVARDIDWLPAECDEGNNAAQLVATCGQDLRPSAMVECHVACTRPCDVIDKRRGVLSVELFERERHDQKGR